MEEYKGLLSENNEKFDSIFQNILDIIAGCEKIELSLKEEDQSDICISASRRLNSDAFIYASIAYKVFTGENYKSSVFK